MSNKMVAAAQTTDKQDSTKQQHEESLAELEQKAFKLIDPALMQLTEGLPRWELDLVVKEADECEKALLKEIALLEEAASAAAKGDNVNKNDDSDKETEKDGSGTTGDGDAKNSTTLSNDMADAQTKAMATLRAQHHEPVVPFQYGLGYPFGSVEEILASDYSTVDRFLTLSSLLGRLFWTTPLPDHHPISLALAKDLKHKKEKDIKKHQQQIIQEKTTTIQRQERLFQLVSHANYTATLATTEEITAMQLQYESSQGQPGVESSTPPPPAANTPTLISLWKKINQHKTAVVFRKPVSDKDAPGYSERILFPMDLSLMKKMITNGIITSLEQLHRKVVLICHNCVKFNGAASDYGMIAREFEKYAEDTLWNAIESVVLSSNQHQNASKVNKEGAPSLALTGTLLQGTSCVTTAADGKRSSTYVQPLSSAMEAAAPSISTHPGIYLSTSSMTPSAPSSASFPNYSLHSQKATPRGLPPSSSINTGVPAASFVVGQAPSSIGASPSNSGRGRGRPSKKRK
jgi:hypothetical protein